MSLKFDTLKKVKHITFRVSIARYSILKEYAAANCLSISDTLEKALDSLLNKAVSYSKIENSGDSLDQIFRALNTLNNKVNELGNQKQSIDFEGIKLPPYFIICLNESELKMMQGRFPHCAIKVCNGIEAKETIRAVKDLYNVRLLVVCANTQKEIAKSILGKEQGRLLTPSSDCDGWNEMVKAHGIDNVKLHISKHT